MTTHLIGEHHKMTTSDNDNPEENNQEDVDLNDEDIQAVKGKLNMIGQYLKDLSFENPNSPESLDQPGENPNIQIEIAVNAGKVKEDIYEVVLEFTADAKSEAHFIYKIELAYAGLFRLSGFPENALQQILLITCPTYLFPFVRTLVLQMSREGGFPSLQLDPIDFASLYKENLQHNQIRKEAVN